MTTAHNHRFSRGNFLLSIALGALVCGTAHAATERMFVYNIDMVPSWKSQGGTYATNLAKLQDGIVNTGFDGGQPVIDFGATYHITKIVYAGRPETGVVTTRMRNAKFYSSMDGVTYTVFHTVASDFDQDTSSLTTNDLSSANVVGRYFKWGGIPYGSITESEFWTDSDVVRISAAEIYGETASGATASVNVVLDGDFASGATAALKVYVAASDLGGDVADWRAGATEVDCGTVASGGEWTGTLPAAVSGGVNYVRFHGTAQNTNGDTITFFSDMATFTAIPFVENRPLDDSSAAMLVYYPTSGANSYKAFDNDETTVASGIQCAIDYGRDVRIDRVRIVTSGDKSVTVPIQFSRDGFTWYTVAKRGRLDFPAANIDLATPIVARYVRYGGDGTTEKNPEINEVRTYALAGEAFVAVTNESARHTKAGLVISGTIAATGLAGGAQVDLYGYAGSQDYGLNKADWDAAGIEPTYIGQYSVGASFTSPALKGTANATSGVRFGAVVAVASGAASSMGTVFPFTLNDETLIDITQEMVVTNYAANSSYSSALTQLWKQGFWGARNFINQNDNRSNGAATLGKKPYRITMIEWHDRPEWGCYGRARSAKFRIYADPDVISSVNYHDMAAASSNWGGNSASIYANRWNSVAPANEEVGCGVGIYGANAGNGFFRFWGFEVPRGLSIHVY